MQNEQLVKVAVAALEDMKGQDITIIDVRGKTSVTDFMVIASGTSSRHVKSMANEVLEKVKEQGVRPIGNEGLDGGDLRAQFVGARIEDHVDAGGDGERAGVVDGGAQDQLIRAVRDADGEAGGQVGGGVEEVGVAGLAEVVAAGELPVGLLGERDVAPRVDVGDVVGV